MTTFEKIKNEGLELFSAHGYDGTSVEDIARKVGIRKASMYSHIKSKDELYLTILQEVSLWDSESLEQLYRLIALAGVRAKLKAIFDYYVHLYRDESVRSKILFLNRSVIFPPEGLREQIAAQIEEHTAHERRIISEIFFEGVNSKRLKIMDARDFQAAYFSMIDGVFVASMHLGRNDYYDRAEAIWSHFWQSVKLL